MIELKPLFTATYELEPALSVGLGPNGDRTVGAIKSAKVNGDRIKAMLAGAAAADYMVRSGPIAAIDVRLTLRTDDDALIYMTYGGRIDLSNLPNGATAFVAPVFERGDERYAWLNGIQAVGKGQLILSADGGRLEYEFHEVC